MVQFLWLILLAACIAIGTPSALFHLTSYIAAIPFLNFLLCPWACWIDHHIKLSFTKEFPCSEFAFLPKRNTLVCMHAHKLDPHTSLVYELAVKAWSLHINATYIIMLPLVCHVNDCVFCELQLHTVIHQLCHTLKVFIWFHGL